jgi:hypothetical protein
LSGPTSRSCPAGTEGVQIALLPFGERALRHFIYLERPEGMALDDAAGFAAARHARPLTAGDAGLVAVPEEWRTVGHLYRGIEAGLASLCARHGEDAVFIGPVRAQAVTEIFEWPELIAVTGLASAGRAIETIVEQGEGARGDWIRSHFGAFVGILEDLLALQAADPAFNPARPVEPAFVRLPAPPPSCCRTRTRPGRSSRNGSMRCSRPALLSASRLVSAHSPHSPASCAR